MDELTRGIGHLAIKLEPETHKDQPTQDIVGQNSLELDGQLGKLESEQMHRCILLKKKRTQISLDSYFNSSSDSDDSESSEYNTLYNAISKKSNLRVVSPLPMYLPSEKMKMANEFYFSSRSLRENQDDIMKTYLNDFKLNEHNIHLVYQMLLEMEDLTCMTDYVRFVQKDVDLNCTNSITEYWIRLQNCPNIEDVVVPFADEVVLVSKQSRLMLERTHLKFKTDILFPYKHEEFQSVAMVCKIKKNRVYFRFENPLSALEINLLKSTKYDIIFRSQRYPLRYQYNAIRLLGTNEYIRKYLCPTLKPNKDLVDLPQLDLKLFNETIADNPEQLIAVQNITAGTNINAPFIIFGPPGTGKTTVVVESIMQLFHRNSQNFILITAGSNSACDTIALRICEYLETNLFSILPKLMLRLYSKSYIKKKNKTPIDANLLKYSNCVTNHHYPSIEEICKYRIIVASLCTVGKLVTCDIGKRSFSHIFIDEAGASTIPEALVAVMGLKHDPSCRLIVSGDHKQLGPIINSERAAQWGLQQSLIEHMLKYNCYAVDDNGNYDHTLQARLRRNYRSHPEILRLFNHLFYDDQLIVAAKEEHVNLAAKWCKLPNPKFPIIFQAVHGSVGKANGSPSSFNRLEIEVVMWFLQSLLNDCIDGETVKQSDIGIITPYKLQNQRIQDRLKAQNWLDIETGSVEAFQGREKQIIIVSFVKSFCGLGFLSNPKRLNVLLSRPQSLLVLVGNPLTLKRNSNFAFILNECKKHDTYWHRK